MGHPLYFPSFAQTFNNKVPLELPINSKTFQQGFSKADYVASSTVYALQKKSVMTDSIFSSEELDQIWVPETLKITN